MDSWVCVSDVQNASILNISSILVEGLFTLLGLTCERWTQSGELNTLTETVLSTFSSFSTSASEPKFFVTSCTGRASQGRMFLRYWGWFREIFRSYSHYRMHLSLGTPVGIFGSKFWSTRQSRDNPAWKLWAVACLSSPILFDAMFSVIRTIPRNHQYSMGFSSFSAIHWNEGQILGYYYIILHGFE